jgi:hypothetical protein
MSMPLLTKGPIAETSEIFMFAMVMPIAAAISVWTIHFFSKVLDSNAIDRMGRPFMDSRALVWRMVSQCFFPIGGAI